MTPSSPPASERDLELSRSRALQSRAHRLIPGGCHTYAKGDDQFPLLSPGFIARGEGCRVWDVDGNEYIEYGMGCRAVTLGHAFPPVIEAVRAELAKGVNFTRPASIEVEAAEAFLDMIATADMVKFAKNGSDATSGAVRLARAATGRDRIAICSDHPFFSVDDWFIGTTSMDAGIPRAIRDLTVRFRYNDLASVREMFDRHPGEIAAVMLEPAKYEDPSDGFLHRLKDLAHAEGALFVLDEMITGFRWANGGGQAYYGVEPDLSTFGKALGNGFSVSALAGKREIMERGGIDHDHERVFLLSYTHGAETHGLAAAIATIRTYREEPVVETLHRQGGRLRAGLEVVIGRHGLADHVGIHGPPQSLVFSNRGPDGVSSQAYRTLFLQELARRGVIGPSFVISYAHSDEDVDRTIEAVDGALPVYRRALEDGVEAHLVGPPSKAVARSRC
ncbi:MAG TPA: glutamate-1-semialdehyde 2,1-aminomutase [Gemmatimonadota bacterium]|nr:glutamate-1-semialdehyde 2,1-aminomutase [Gemmatimonadota bacterium]